MGGKNTIKKDGLYFGTGDGVIYLYVCLCIYLFIFWRERISTVHLSSKVPSAI